MVVGSKEKSVYLLDYGAGNVRSVRNAINFLGYQVIDIRTPEQLQSLEETDKVIFPGVGNFFQAAKFLQEKGFAEPLRNHILNNRPFFGICLGMQCLFEGSDEFEDVPGLGVIPGRIKHFASNSSFDTKSLSVPHIGWNQLNLRKDRTDIAAKLLQEVSEEDRTYFVHSFRAEPTDKNKSWVLTTTDYGGDFISSIAKGNVYATQFHPEKSGKIGLQILKNFLFGDDTSGSGEIFKKCEKPLATGLSKRVIACMDVRRDEAGELIITKGLGYNVVSEDTNKIRNMGSPVARSEEYFNQGCDELCFLSITSHAEDIMGDSPLHKLLEEVSQKVFVPLSIGGGIRNYTDSKSGRKITALEIAGQYFRSGADKVSIGSDAVRAVEKLLKNNYQKDGSSSIEQISQAYGCQAVVISFDVKRIYLDNAEIEKQRALGRKIFDVEDRRSASSTFRHMVKCIYIATTAGGKNTSEIDVIQLVKGVEFLGAGEVLLNCLDTDGRGTGFDLALINGVCEETSLPVIASSGAGCKEHFSDVFKKTRAEAALASGIFHRNEVTVGEVKQHLVENEIPARIS